MGPRAPSFWVEMPISQPKPNSPPSVKRVEAFTYTAALSTAVQKACAAASSPVMMALGMARGMGRNVGHRLFQAAHHAHGQNIIQKLGVKIVRPGGRARDDGRRARAKAQLGVLFGHALGQHGQKLPRHSLVHQAHLGRVAHGRAAGFGVIDNGERHCKVGRPVHIDMADACARLNAGHLGLFHTGANQPLAPAGNQKVHQAARGHQLARALAGGVLHKAHQRRRQPGRGKPRVQGVHNGRVRAYGLFAAAQHAHVAALQAQGRGVCRDVGAAFVNNGHHTHRHAPLLQHKAVGQRGFGQRFPHRALQRRHAAQARRHGRHPLGRKAQAVQHHVADAAPGRRKVLLVGGPECRPARFPARGPSVPARRRAGPC